MTRKGDYEAYLTVLLNEDFDERYGTTVPTSETVSLKNGAVHLDAVYLYADMADSSGMVRRFTPETSAKIVRSYLSTVTRVLQHHEGAIRSFDGDRVMAIFIGEDAADRAAQAALEVKWVVDNVVHSELEFWLSEYGDSTWRIRHRTGIDVGTAFIIRGGVRANNDLVSIGDAPNIAAKLSALKGSRTWITDRLWDAMSSQTCFSSKTGDSMWTAPVVMDVGGHSVKVRSSNWGWVVW